MIQIAILALGAIFAVVGIVFFARKGISGKNAIKIFGAEFQLAGSSLVIFVLGCVLIIFAAQLNNEPKHRQPVLGPAAEDIDTSLPTLREPPDFISGYVFPPDLTERIEFEFEAGMLPKEDINDFLRLLRVAFDVNHQTFNVRLLIKNTGTQPILLDLDHRFFSLEDDQGRGAAIIYFCCKSEGDLLAAGQEREVQLFFQSSGWHGKEVTARWIFFRVRGFLPVIRASWKMPVLVTAD